MCLPEKHMRDNMAATCRNFQVLSDSWSKSEMGFGICLAVGQSPKWVPRFVPQLVEFRNGLRDSSHSWSKSEVGCGMLCRWWSNMETAFGFLSRCRSKLVNSLPDWPRRVGFWTHSSGSHCRSGRRLGRQTGGKGLSTVDNALCTWAVDQALYMTPAVVPGELGRAACFRERERESQIVRVPRTSLFFPNSGWGGHAGPFREWCRGKNTRKHYKQKLSRNARKCFADAQTYICNTNPEIL